MKNILICGALVLVFFIFGFMAGFLARDNRIKQETINAQEKRIDNTVGLKKEVCKVEERIKKYEVNCSDILDFDLSKCLQGLSR